MNGIPVERVASLSIYCCVKLEDVMSKHDQETYDGRLSLPLCDLLLVRSCIRICTDFPSFDDYLYISSRLLFGTPNAVFPITHTMPLCSSPVHYLGAVFAPKASGVPQGEPGNTTWTNPSSTRGLQARRFTLRPRGRGASARRTQLGGRAKYPLAAACGRSAGALLVFRAQVF